MCNYDESLTKKFVDVSALCTIWLTIMMVLTIVTYHKSRPFHCLVHLKINESKKFQIKVYFRLNSFQEKVKVQFLRFHCICDQFKSVFFP